MKIEKKQLKKIVDGVECIEEITYRVYEDGTKEVACTFCSPKETEEPVTLEPSQLDRIEYAVNKSQEQIAQEARDSYTDLLMEEGVL